MIANSRPRFFQLEKATLSDPKRGFSDSIQHHDVFTSQSCLLEENRMIHALREGSQDSGNIGKDLKEGS